MRWQLDDQVTFSAVCMKTWGLFQQQHCKAPICSLDASLNNLLCIQLLHSIRTTRRPDRHQDLNLDSE